MNKLILVKHAAPEVDPAANPEFWRLSERGRATCAPLAERLRPFNPSIIITSNERKAIETGELLAAALGISCESAPGLEEHDRSNVPHLRSSEFISMIELFFRRPDELVLGRETANAAEERFTAALKTAVDQHAGKDLAIVSHGTVIALFLARLTNRPGFQLWRELGLPSFAAISLPEHRMIEIVPRI